MPVDFNIELRLSLLRAAQAAIEEEEEKVQMYRDFYDGDQGVKLTDRQKEYLIQELESFGNICKRVVAVPGDRLNIPEDGIKPINIESKDYADRALTWWSDVSESDETNDKDISSEQQDVYTASLRDGSVAVIVDWDEGREKPTFTPNLIYDGVTGLVRFHYDESNKLLFASKRWTAFNPLEPGVTGTRRLTVYTAGAIERFEADKGQATGWRSLSDEEAGVANPQPWTDDQTFNGNPLGIPVIPFENPIGSELQDVISIQELLNHNLGTFDIVTDHHAFPIIWFRNARFLRDDATGYSRIPTFGPGQAIDIPGTDSSMNRLEPADLKKLFDAGFLNWIQVLSIIKGWPSFLLDKTAQPPSGIALTIMEKGLVSQVKRKQVAFGGSWRQAFNMARKLHLIHTNEELPGQIIFEWDPAGTEDPKTSIEVLEKKFDAGDVPKIQRWRELGYSDEDIEQMMEDEMRADPAGVASTQLTQLALEREQAMMRVEEDEG